MMDGEGLITMVLLSWFLIMFLHILYNWLMGNEHDW
jgi:hypothetical protein